MSRTSKSWYKRALDLDPRWIFLSILVLVAVPYFVEMSIPVVVSKYTINYYNEIEEIPDGSTVLFESTILPGFWPMSGSGVERTYVQLRKKNLKIVAMTFREECAPQVEIGLNNAKKLMPAGVSFEYGIDYVNLGFIAGYETGIAAFVSDIRSLINTDDYGTPLDEIPIMEGINTGSDFSITICAGGGTGHEAFHIRQITERFGIKTLSIASTMMISGYTPYIQAGQMPGILVGLVGCAEYEFLMNLPGPALVSSNSASFGCLTIVFYVIAGNVLYFYGKLSGKED